MTDSPGEDFSIPEGAFAGKRLLLAVSGGLDSISLADYFVRHRKTLGVRWIGIAHVHHGLRENANVDAKFVEDFAHKLNIPFYIRHLDGFRLRKSGSIEENARNARYLALHEIAKLPEVRADGILTAHHTNDQAETLLMRISRGTTLRGLRGILPRREDGIERPFLKVPKENLLAYAQKYDLDFREDESNADETFDRNAIRRRILPMLERENVHAVEQLSRISDLGTRVDEKISKKLDEALSPFIVPPKLWPFSAEISPYERVLALHDAAWETLAKKSVLGAATLLRMWLDGFGFSFPSSVDFRSNFADRKGALRYEKSRRILWFCKNPRSCAFHNLYLFKQEESISGEWRFRKDGDVYHPANGQPKALKKWFGENGIPSFARDSVPLFSQGSRILRIGGIPLDKGNL